MKILVINCGSSTIKYQLFNKENDTVLCSGIVERISEPMGRITHKNAPDTEAQTKTILEEPFPTHAEGMKKVVDLMLNGDTAIINDVNEIVGVGHRIVHGGSYSKPVVVTQEVIDELRKVIPLAPLHNPGHILGIEVAQEIFNTATHVTVFDTAFHQTMPEHVYTYPLPADISEKYSLRKYGFHGTSHKYVSNRAAEILQKDVNDCNFISCHIGSGASVCAIENGKCVDTSMGLTPLDGLMMGTRCGSIDPAIIGFLMRNADMTIDEVDTLITKKSGLLGVCGNNDMRDIDDLFEQGDEKGSLAMNMFTYRIRNYIGSYLLQLAGKVDALIFTAGVGENDNIMRREVLKGLESFGFILDQAQNDVRPGEYAMISTPESPIKIMVVRTNEELEIANETVALI